MEKNQTLDRSEVLKKALAEIRRLKKESGGNSKIKEPIAIVGMACRFPKGASSPEKFWKALEDQKDLIGPLPEKRRNQNMANWEKSPFLKEAGYLEEDINGFDHRLFRFSPREAERTDPQQRLFLKVCWEALENSGYAPDRLRGSKTGVYAGIMLMEYMQQLGQERKLTSRFDPFDVSGNGFSFLSGRVSYFFGFQGPGITTDTACSSSLVSIDTACKGLWMNDCDMALAGGVNLLLSQEYTALFSELNILSPECRSRSFDASANGTVRGEGCGVVVLKKLADAEKDGDHIHAVIKATGVNQGGLASGPTVPHGPSQEALIEEVWKKAGIEQQGPDYIEAHGTGTEIGDPIEMNSLINLLPNKRYKPVYVGTVKSSMGHLEAAAGVAGFIKTVMALKNEKIPANLHFKQPSSHINWKETVVVPQHTIEWEPSPNKPRNAAISSFGLSGTNAHIVLEQYLADRKTTNGSRQVANKKWPFRFTAPNSKGLAKQISAFLDHLEANEVPNIGDLSYTQNITRAGLKERILIWAENQLSLKDNLKTVLSGKINSDVELGKATKKVVFLFTGSGSQYPGMFKEYYAENPIFKKYVDQCVSIYNEYSDEDLLSVIFSNNERVHEVCFTQIALFVVEYALAMTWMSYGVSPNYLIGHSTGEYVAACLAEVFTLKDAVHLMTTRGQLMYTLPSNGSMAVVRLDEPKLADKLSAYPNLSIAGINSPEQTVVSGDDDELEQLSQQLSDEDIEIKRVMVTSASHSPLMKPMIAPFEDVSKQISYHNPKIPIISNVTGKQINGEMANYTYWSKHILSTVQFYQSIQSLGNLNDYVFLEVGPKGVLTQMVDIIAEGEAEYLVSNIPDQSTSLQMERCLFHFANSGWSISWENFYKHSDLRKETIPNYQFMETPFALSEGTKKLVADIYRSQSLSIDSTAPSTEENKQFFSGHFNLQSPVALLEKEENQDPLSFIAGSSATLPNELNEVKAIVQQNVNDALGVEEGELSSDENLLLFGIDSILVARLIKSWKKEYNILLKPAPFIKHPTISSWSALLIEAANEKHEDHSEVFSFVEDLENRYEPFPLNEVQNAYWVGRTEGIQWGGYSCYGYIEVEAETLDADRFIFALHKLVERHEMLRVIVNGDGKQQILQKAKFEPEVFKYEASNDLTAHLDKIRSEMCSQTLPLGQLMFDIKLTETSPGNWLIHMGLDFIVADASSINIFWNDLYRFYCGKELNKPEVSFRDYVLHQEKVKLSTHYQRCKHYWQTRLESLPEAPKVPVISNSPKEFKGSKRFEKVLDEKTWKAFTSSAASQNLTPSAALLLLYSEILSAWGAGSHFGLMLTVFERQDVHPEINDIIGDFTQLVLLEVNRSHQSLAKNGHKLQWQMQEDLAHSAYSSVDVIKDISRRNGTGQLYPFVFTSALGIEGNDKGNSAPYFGKIKNFITQTPQVWLDAQVTLINGQICLSWDCHEEMFLEGVLDSMFQSYTQLVQNVARDTGLWERSINDARPANQMSLHNKANDTKTSLEDQLLHQGILEHAKIYKKKTAIICDGVSYSYAELIDSANRVSSLVQSSYGLKSGEHVAVQLPKSFEMIAVVIGILQAGGVYVPIQHDNPVSRTETILKQSNTRLIILEDEVSYSKVDVQQFSIAKGLDDGSKEWKKTSIALDQSAYIIFTSGSTGVPKGVEISHKAAMNTIMDVSNRFGITSSDCVLGISALSFDLSVYDIFGVLGVGGTLVLPTEAERIDPRSWYQLSKEFGVTLWNTVPALLDLYVDYINSNPELLPDENIQQTFLSGDWIALSLHEKMTQALPNARMISMGGATEASIWSNYHEVSKVEPHWKSIPYGYPLANQAFHVLDEFGRPCPNWVEGKLHIAGTGLAKGYYNAKELTEKAFYTHPNLQLKLYDTGDHGRYLPNGELEFMGRQDDQLKINGYRIEIGEIQAAFKKCDSSLDPVIVPVGKKTESKKLVAFVKTSLPHFSEAKLKHELTQHLPSYFIPDLIIPLETYPVTSNGKIDRKQLIDKASELETIDLKVGNTDVESVDNRGYIHPVLKAVRQVFDMPSLSVHDRFDELGVSSMDIIRLSNQLEASFLDRPSVGEMVRYGSAEELIHFYQSNGTEFTKEDNLQHRNDASSIDPQFLIYTSEQMKYLSSISIIEKFEERQAHKKKRVAERKELTSKKRISLATEATYDLYSRWRKTYRQFLDRKVPFEEFRGYLNLCAAQVMDEKMRFSYASAGGIYPLQVYLTVFKDKVAEVEEGYYYFNSYSQELVLLSQEEIIPPTELNFDHEWLEQSAFAIHLVADMDAIYPIYQKESLPFCQIESGLISQLLESEGAHFNVGTCQLGGYDFASIKDHFQLSERHIYIHSLAAGAINFKQEKVAMQYRIESLGWQKHTKKLNGLLAECKQKGVQLWVENDKLKFKAPEGALDSTLLSDLKEVKPHLISYLQSDTFASLMKQSEPFELTPIQSAFLMGREGNFELSNVGTHFYSELIWPHLDVPKMEKIVNEIINIHGALRTVIHRDGTQSVLFDQPYYEIEISEKSPEEIRSIRSHHKYPLGEWPMFHFEVSQANTAYTKIHMSVDLLILDAWSADLLMREIFKAYHGESLKEPDYTFKKYIADEQKWHQEHKQFMERAENYWNSKLENLPERPALPFKKPLSEIKNPIFRRLKFSISDDVMRVVNEKAEHYQLTPTAVFATLFSKTLSHWSGGKALTLNTTLFNRMSLHPDVNEVMGDFTNVALISYDPDTEKSFKQEVSEIQDQLWQAIEYRAKNGLELLQQLNKNKPGKAVMPVVFTSLLSGESANHENDFFPKGVKEDYAVSQTPQVVIDHQIYRRGDAYLINWDVVEEAFDIELLNETFSKYEKMINQAVTATDWNKKL